MFEFKFILTEWFRNIFPENKHQKKAAMTHMDLIKVDEKLLREDVASS